jgi:GT2 family glycosyltransferase
MPEQLRIVLVDNGSTHDTAAAVARQFPRIEILDAGGNLGAAGSRTT